MNNRRVLQWTIIGILACAGLYLIGNGRVALWDRDEPWYAQCSLKMIQSGDYAVPRYLDGSLRTEKPPMIYWLHTVAMKVLGDGEFAPRLVSSMCMTLVLVMLAVVVWRMAGPRRAAWTTFIFGTCALAIAAGKMCLTDAALMCCLVPVQFTLLEFYRGRGNIWHVFILALGIALGGFVKGPIVFVAPAMTLLVLAVFDFRRWTAFIKSQPQESLRRVGYTIFVILIIFGAVLVIIGPWMYINHEREPNWLAQTRETAKAHIEVAQDGHTGYPGWYFLLMWGTFFPWSLLVPTAAAIAWRHRHTPQIRFAIAAILGPWLFHEFLMKTKLPHYMLGTYPFLALLTADAIVRCLRGQYNNFVRPSNIKAIFVWAVLIGGIPSLVWVTTRKNLGFADLPYTAMAVMSVFGYVYTLGVWWLFHRRRPAYAVAWLGGGFVILIAIAYGWYVPNAHFIGISRPVAAMLKQEGAAAGINQTRSAATLIYHLPADANGKRKRTGWEEPSLVYYQGGTLKKIFEDDYLERQRPKNWPDVMVITPAIWEMSPQDVRDRLHVVGKVRGLLYEGGLEAVELWVVRKQLTSEDQMEAGASGAVTQK